MPAGISLANKSQLLFGCAVVIILGGALAVPWVWTQSLVANSQREMMRQLYEAWLSGQIQLGRIDERSGLPMPYGSLTARDPVRISFVRIEDIDSMIIENDVLTRAMRYFDRHPDAVEYMEESRLDGQDVHHYARRLRESDMRRIQDRRYAEFPPDAADPAVADRFRALLVIDRRSDFASSQLLVTSMYIVAAWLFASLLAILMFYLILKRLILSPVRSLRETAEKIEHGEITIRANIRTGDEFEQLSSAFNSMLERFAESQRQLRSMNETLDLRVGELAEANIALFESNRLKGEFLASVSHELKTPLNLIIGFGELLEEIARSEPDADPKRLRYIENILAAARSLLEMITDLLAMARIEAGRVEVSIEPTDIHTLLGGLQRLVQSEADRCGLELRVECPRGLPPVETDAGKLQQILYNFVSNALKFTPPGGRVTIRAQRVGPAAAGRHGRLDVASGVRVSVIDTGPGIPHDLQEVIFEKFRQADASHTRQYEGFGLGLAICRELATLLGGRLSLESEPGEGAAFSIELPLAFEHAKPEPLMAEG